MMLAQASSCPGNGAALMASARAHADAFEMTAAVNAFDAAALAGCADARLPAIYLRGLVAARDAYRLGGSPESLEPVNRALARLDAELLRAGGDIEIARFVLRAAIAAAQSERDELGLLIDHAVDLEAQRRTAKLTGAPVVSAHEVAGDLWLQVHRYEDARRAYQRAAQQIGMTMRVRLGLARTANRLGDSRIACEQYEKLIASWHSDHSDPVEIVEARTFVRQPTCRMPTQPQ